MARILRNTIGIESLEGKILQTYFDERFDNPTVGAGGAGFANPALTTDGYEYFNFNFTPNQIGSILEISCQLTMVESGNTGNARFQGVGIVGETNMRIVAMSGKPNDGTGPNSCMRDILFGRITTTSLSPINFTVRGTTGSTIIVNNIQLNGSSGNHSQSGSWIHIREIGV